MSVRLSKITPQEAALKAGCKVLPLTTGGCLALERGKDIVGVLLVEGAEAALFLPNDVDAQVLDFAKEEAASRGAASLYVRAPLGFSLPEPFGKGRELLAWQRTPDDGPLPDPEEKLEPAPFSIVKENFDRWHPSRPPWERRREALFRAPEAFGESLRVNVIRQNGRITAYIAYVLEGNDLLVLDAAVDPDVGVVKAGRPVFQALYLTYQEHDVIAPSVPVDDPLNKVFVAMRYHVVERANEWFLHFRGGDFEESA